MIEVVWVKRTMPTPTKNNKHRNRFENVNHNHYVVRKEKRGRFIYRFINPEVEHG